VAENDALPDDVNIGDAVTGGTSIPTPPELVELEENLEDVVEGHVEEAVEEFEREELVGRDSDDSPPRLSFGEGEEGEEFVGELGGVKEEMVEESPSTGEDTP